MNLFPVAASIKFIYATGATVATTFAINLYTLVAQIDAGSSAGQIVPAAALTATSGALVWAMKQVVGGVLVHRDAASSEKKLQSLIETAHKREEQAGRREEVYTNWLLGNRKDNDAKG